MNRKNLSKNLKLFLLFYILGYMIFNWSDISWVFNYKAVGGLVYDFFNPYQGQDMVAAYYQNQTLPTPTIPEVMQSPESKSTEIKTLPTIKTETSDKENVLEIPNISLTTDIVFPQTTDVDVLHKFLDSGIIYYPGSVKPDQIGQITMLGHSAPPGWPKIKHDWVFSNLQKLNNGDTIYLNYDYKRYTYKVIDKKIINRGQEIPQNLLTDKTNVIVLVSCYPPGKDYQRIIVWAQIENTN